MVINGSTMRFCFILCVVTSCVIGLSVIVLLVVLAVLNFENLFLVINAIGQVALLIGAILGSAFIGKAVQSFSQFDTEK